MLICNTSATFQLSEQNGNPSILNDDSFVLHEHQYPDAIPYHQVIRYITNMCLAASDGASSGKEFLARPDAPSLVKNVPDPNEGPSVVGPACLSHGCQCQQLHCLSHKAIPHTGYPMQSVPSYTPSRLLEPQQVSFIMILPFKFRC